MQGTERPFSPQRSQRSKATPKTHHPSAGLRAGYGTETRRNPENQLQRGDAEKTFDLVWLKNLREKAQFKGPRSTAGKGFLLVACPRFCFGSPIEKNLPAVAPGFIQVHSVK